MNSEKMNNHKMTEEFEVWQKTQISSLIRTGHIEAARKFGELGSIHWFAWQASRAALLIELPESFEHETEGFLDPLGDAVYVDDLTKIIESLGLKVKQNGQTN